eukprot:672299-Rhodomonas_salina.2
MPGTDQACTATCLRACYAMSGTELAYGAARSARPQHASRPSRAATPGTEAYLPTRVLCGVRTGLAYLAAPISLQALCALSGTDLAYAATRSPRGSRSVNYAPRRMRIAVLVLTCGVWCYQTYSYGAESIRQRRLEAGYKAVGGTAISATSYALFCTALRYLLPIFLAAAMLRCTALLYCRVLSGVNVVELAYNKRVGEDRSACAAIYGCNAAGYGRNAAMCRFYPGICSGI